MFLQSILGGYAGVRFADELPCTKSPRRCFGLFLVFLQPFFKHCLLPFLHWCRVIHHPPLRDVSIFGCMLPIPIALVRARLQGKIRGNELLDLVQGRRNPPDPEGMGAEGGEILGGTPSSRRRSMVISEKEG